MKDKTPMRTVEEVNQRECGLQFGNARRIARVSLNDAADHLEMSITTLWLYERGNSRAKWTPELFNRAMKFIASNK